MNAFGALLSPATNQINYSQGQEKIKARPTHITF